MNERATTSAIPFVTVDQMWERFAGRMSGQLSPVTLRQSRVLFYVGAASMLDAMTTALLNADADPGTIDRYGIRLGLELFDWLERYAREGDAS